MYTYHIFYQIRLKFGIRNQHISSRAFGDFVRIGAERPVLFLVSQIKLQLHMHRDFLKEKSVLAGSVFCVTESCLLEQHRHK